MSATQHDQEQFCPQCGNHCPVDALRCGRGRKYFGAADGDGGHDHAHDHGCGHGQLEGLPGLLHQCGRFVRHAGAGEDEMFQVLTGEEKAALQALLEKLTAGWKAQFGEEALGGCRHGRHDHKAGKHHHKHEDHGK